MYLELYSDLEIYYMFRLALDWAEFILVLSQAGLRLWRAGLILSGC